MIQKLLQRWRRYKMRSSDPELQKPGAHRDGDSRPLQIDDVLSAALYPELKRIAKARMQHERLDHTLQPTALINELYLHLLRKPEFIWKDRNHFLKSASRAMR